MASQIKSNLFVKQFVQANINGKIKAVHHWLLVIGIHRLTVDRTWKRITMKIMSLASSPPRVVQTIQTITKEKTSRPVNHVCFEWYGQICSANMFIHLQHCWVISQHVGHQYISIHFLYLRVLIGGYFIKLYIPTYLLTAYQYSTAQLLIDTHLLLIRYAAAANCLQVLFVWPICSICLGSGTGPNVIWNMLWIRTPKLILDDHSGIIDTP